MERFVKAVVGDYEEIGKKVASKQWRCSYALFSNDGDFADVRGPQICHMGLTNKGWAPAVKDGTYDQIITSYPVSGDHWLTFFNFLVTHLFKEWSHIIHLEQTPEGQYYIRVSDLSAIPADVLYNFCIFTRVPWEFSDAVLRWEQYVKSGMHPGFAFAVCRTRTYYGKVVDILYAGNNNHWPIDNTVHLDRLVSSSPKHSGIMYKSDNSQCVPCNKIWGITSFELKGLIGRTVEDFWNEWKAKHEDILLSS